MRKTAKLFAIFAFLASTIFATNDFPIVEFPTWVVSSQENIWIKWADLQGNLNNNTIYFSRNPGGANTANYTDSIKNVVTNNRILDGNDKGKTGTMFKLSDNPNFKPGINYVVVGDKKAAKGTISSNEIKLILKHNEQNTNLKPSGGLVDNSTPQFSWTKPAGVPYSHIILSDEEIQLNLDGTISLESIKGISMIWQAITPNNRITYGEPDPSGIFKTTPPPLSPGKKYTWMVFNNYGNNPAYTPLTDFVLPAFFGISGPQRPEPKNAFPLTKNNLLINSPDNITFKWTNLDPNASVYRVFVYTSAKMGGADVQLVVWSGETTAGQFKKSDGTMMDTASFIMSAKDILSKNLYSWRVIAVYNDGSGQSGTLDYFNYSAPAGKIIVRTQEEIKAKTADGKDTTFTQWVSAAEVKMEVLDGSTEESILFYTDNNGYADRYRAAGTSKVTANKPGYESGSQIVTLEEGGTSTAWITLHKPISSIYGRITDTNGNPVDLANVTAVSDHGDTVKVQSLPDGNFIINCKPESWTLTAGKQGYSNSLSRRVVLTKDAVSEQNISIEKSSLVFSGSIRTTIKNQKGQDTIVPIAGATIKILLADGKTEVASLLSTPSNGRFSFHLLQGTYIVNSSKTGLVSVSDTMKFSASQDRQILLAGGAALLKGTLRGTSWISQNETLKSLAAAVTNAKVEVLNSSTNAVIATSATDKVYGTYSISIPTQNPPIKYMLRFTADGFDTALALTDAAIESGNTYSQDFSIDAFATISGKVFDETGENTVSGVSVSLIKDRQAVSTSATNSNGDFTFFRVSKGDYLISANGAGRAKDSVALIESGTNGNNIITNTDDLVTIKSGKFTKNDLDVATINITTKEANSSIIWKTVTNGNTMANDPSIAITLYSPFVQKIENGTLSNIHPSANYFVRATSSINTNIIDCIEKETIFADSEEKTLNDEILMPFRYVPTTDNTIKLYKWAKINIDDYSVLLNYRQHGETNFDSLITNFNKTSDTLISFDIPHKLGNNIDFYFNLSSKSDSTKYSNKTHPYTKFVAADPKIITRWEVLPAIDNVTLPLNGRMEFVVKAYYGANFTEIKNLNDSSFVWATTTGKISTGKSGLSNVITGSKYGEDTIIVTIKDDSEFKTGNKSIALPIKITDSEIGSIKAILLSGLAHPEFMTNKERAIFGVEAKDKKGNPISAMPQWIVTPKTAGTINSQTGLFTPDTNFIGRVSIIAQINSRIRDEFILNGKKGLLIAYTVTQNGGIVSDYDVKSNKIAELTFGAKATQNPIIISLDKPEINNSIERDVEEVGTLIISDIFDVRRQVGENFVNPDSVSMKLFIPQIYHKNFTGGQSDKNRLDIAIWDKDSLRWEYQSRRGYLTDKPSFEISGITYDEKEKSLSFSIGEHINNFNDMRVAIIARGLKEETEISISPNPFSPFVSPMNDYFNIADMNGDVKGTCIKITPKSNSTKFKPSAQVSIFTADGTAVYRATLNGLDAGQSYYLFWDGRVQLSQTEINKIVIAPNKALFVKGNEMCRNGRYFVNVTTDNGKEKKRYTKEIILFK